VVAVSGAHVDLGAGALASICHGDDVGVVLEHRQHDAVAGLEVLRPQLCATRLMPSVAPRTKTISSRRADEAGGACRAAS
jgi:hypothetical protein